MYSRVITDNVFNRREAAADPLSTRKRVCVCVYVETDIRVCVYTNGTVQGG